MTSQSSHNDCNKFRVKSQKLHTKALCYGTTTETSHTNHKKFRA